MLGEILKDLEHFITTKTVVGEPINVGDTILVPLVDVSFGIGTGSKSASKLKEKNKEKERYVDGPSDTSGGGVGANISPSAVLVIQNGTTQLINIKNQDSLTKLIDMAPGILSNIPSIVSKFAGKNKDEADKDEKDENETVLEDYHELRKK
ncbi:sporulation protein [Candidatus Epulonipiscium fishelsonii]|uniref:Sporulation protein n=1 Tax=Candidatus Epulonipiscium fishelsonii TaxID=77094 RepID=A0ACC8XBZ0_9FIRM|nr:sporulation protein [Epulopiscium sp. SCG-D08WGA-EpuloA1]OON95917.1 MAG: sporulation protein [Epulopiscium sp. AS2M-Bin002]